jgi:aldose 1-epimerase
VIPPSGEQHEISGAGYTAVVTEVGASLRLLRSGGRDLVTGWEEGQLRPVFRGALLAPWPNRVGDGRYAFGGRQHQLPVNEADRRTAVHGLVAWEPWRLVDRTEDAVTLAYRIWPRDGYPFLLDLTVTYTLGDTGLTTRLDAVNAGEVAAPWGCAPHPYVVSGPGRVDDWTLELPADRVLEVDAERLLPARPPVTRPVGDLDFRAGRLLGDVRLDHAFTALAPDGDGRVAAVVRAADGTGVQVAWDAGRLPWVQVHTADRPEPGLDRAGLAVEPMTCPPDAFRSGVDLVVLEPGQRHAAEWEIRAVG